MNKEKIYGVFLQDQEHVVVIAGPVNIVLLVKLDLSEVVYSFPILTRKQLWGVCKAINENRLSCFDSQTFMSMILEKYPPESLIYE